MLSPVHRRLHRACEPSPVQHPCRKQHQKPSDVKSQFQNQLFDIAAIHSGDETSEGSSDLGNNDEDESDRMFLQELPETQLSPSYDQTLAYRQSLFTQAVVGPKAPTFANHPVRHGAVRGRPMRPRSRPLSSSSPPNSEPDDYVYGSFVVDDDEDLLYLSSE
jgi:ATP-dependent DNA helicase MPH1